MADAKDAKISLPEYRATSLEDIAATTARLRATYRSGKTKDVQYRLVQLRKLYWGLVDNTDLIAAAMMKDLRKPRFEVMLSELDMALTDLIFAINNLERWARDEPFKDLPLHLSLLKVRIRKEPLGMALVIGAYNFPVVLGIMPLVGVIAAGCTGVLKPSENSPATAMALKKVVEESLDPEAYAVINGAVPETTALLDTKFDKICYTGGNAVGRIVAKKAAETLTPVLLELGGRNPAFVTRHADLALAARRLLWGKTLNAGQICISQNYMLVERAVLDSFLAELVKVHAAFFPEGARASPDLARIVNERQFFRMKRMLDGTKGRIVLGGEMDEAELFIAPTVVLVDSADDSVVVEESFGPIVAVMPFDTLDEAIEIANKVDPTPLTLMTFGSDEENEKVINEVTSGGANLNENFMSGSLATGPFGGVGQSGTGAYRGVASFEAFTHRRVVVRTPSWLERLLRVRYMPYNLAELERMRRLAGPRPDFDRQGRKVGTLTYYAGAVLGLGAGGAKGAFVRWLLVLLSAYAVAQQRKGRLGSLLG